MIANARTTLAQILFRRRTTCDLTDVVADLDRLLAPCLGLGHRLSWHGTDTATLDLGVTRVTLRLSALPRDGRTHRLCLSVAVGSVPGLSSDTPPGRRHADLARKIVRTVEARHDADFVIWQQVAEAMSPGLLADLAAAVPVDPHPAWAVGRARAVPQAASNVSATAEQDQLHIARSAIWVEPAWAGDARPSIPLRIAATAMASTVAIVALPVGAALITYTLFRGADFRLSAHVMALTGTFLGLSQTPAGQSFLSALI